MASEPTKWGPNKASMDAYAEAIVDARASNMSEKACARIAISEAVAADPLLSAAADMRDALDQLADLAAAFSVSGVYFNELCFADNVKALQDAYAALAKAKGES